MSDLELRSRQLTLDNVRTIFVIVLTQSNVQNFIGHLLTFSTHQIFEMSSNSSSNVSSDLALEDFTLSKREIKDI